MRIYTFLFIGLVAASLSACGSGDFIEKSPTNSNSTQSTQVLAPGTYKLAFSAISTARLAAPVSGIDVAVKLPVGVSVTTLTGSSGQVAVSSVIPGSAIQSTSLAFASYSASTRTVYLSMTTSQDSYRGGQFVNLLFNVGAGTSVTPNDIFALNTTYPKYKVVGFDSVTHSSVNLTSALKTSLAVEQ
jgi:hypothetical protein